MLKLRHLQSRGKFSSFFFSAEYFSLKTNIVSISAMSSSERTMDLVVEMCNTRSIHWCGISGRQLGKLSPGGSLLVPLTIFSSVQGLQVRSERSTVAFQLFSSNTDSFLFVSEHFWTQTHRHVSKEDLRIR